MAIASAHGHAPDSRVLARRRVVPGGLSILTPRGDGETEQRITITRKIDLVRLQMKIEKGDSRRFQATVRQVGRPHVWNQRLLKPRSGVITVNVPADKLPVEDYILTLLATTPAGEMEEINSYAFRILKK